MEYAKIGEYVCDICGKIFDHTVDMFHVCGKCEDYDTICPTCYPKIKECNDELNVAFIKYYADKEQLQKECEEEEEEGDRNGK